MQLKSQASGTWKRAREGDADLRRFFPTAQWLMLAIAGRCARPCRRSGGRRGQGAEAMTDGGSHGSSKDRLEQLGTPLEI